MYLLVVRELGVHIVVSAAYFKHAIVRSGLQVPVPGVGVGMGRKGGR